MAVSSIANLFSFFTPSKPPPPTKNPSLQFSLAPTVPNSSSKPNQEPLFPLVSTNNNDHNTLQLSSSGSDITSVVCPSLAYANTLFFSSAYNVQVIVGDDEPEEELVGRFRREVLRAGVIQECKRRRYYEHTKDKKKRKAREAARRNRRRRGPPRFFEQDTEEPSTTETDDDDDDEDNWEIPVGDIPY